MDIKELALEARKFKEEKEKAAAAKTAKEEAPAQEYLEVADYPDIVLKKEMSKRTDRLVIMPSVGGYYIKTTAANGTESMEELNETNYGRFMTGMPEIKLPDGFWFTHIRPGKKGYERLMATLGRPEYLDMIRHHSFPQPFTSEMHSAYLSYDEEKWQKPYRTSPTLWNEYANDRKTATLMISDPNFIRFLVDTYGLNNARDFLTEYKSSLMTLKNQWGVRNSDSLSRLLAKGGGQLTILGRCLKDSEYKRFKQYVLYDSVQMGYALSLENFFYTWFDTTEMQQHVYREVREKYPMNLAGLHQVLSYREALMKEEIEEYKLSLACANCAKHEDTIDGFVFKAPSTRDDIHDEAVQQANCLAGYVNKFAEGECELYFMRKTAEPDKSYITIEVIGGRVVQAKCRYNKEPSFADWSIIRRWESRQFGTAADMTA